MQLLTLYCLQKELLSNYLFFFNFMFDYCGLFSWLPIVGIVQIGCCFNVHCSVFVTLIYLVTGPIVSKSVPVCIGLFKQILVQA